MSFPKKARALYPFQARNSKELDLVVDEIITILEPYDDTWYSAEVKGKQGYVPQKFVELLDLSNLNGQDFNQDGMYARVKQPSNPKDSSQLTVSKGDIVEVLNQYPTGWFQCSFKGKTGLVQSSNLDILQDFPFTDEAAKTKPVSNSVTSKMRALQSHKASNEDELEFEAGEEIEVLEKVDKLWWKGSVRGKFGKFPKSCVEQTVSTQPSDSPPIQQKSTSRKLGTKSGSNLKDENEESKSYQKRSQRHLDGSTSEKHQPSADEVRDHKKKEKPKEDFFGPKKYSSLRNLESRHKDPHYDKNISSKQQSDSEQLEKKIQALADENALLVKKVQKLKSRLSHETKARLALEDDVKELAQKVNHLQEKFHKRK